MAASGTSILPSTTEPVLSPYKEPLKPVEEGHGYLGTVAFNKEGTHLQCHECGLFFENLASHIKSHDMTAYDYRAKYEIAESTKLIGETVKKRQQGRWWELPPEEQEKVKAKLKAYAQTTNSTPNGNKRKDGKQHLSNFSLERRNKDGQCPDQTIDKIIELAEKMGRTPTQRETMKEYGTGIMGQIRHYYGSWSMAIKIADLQPASEFLKREYTAEALLDRIILFRKEFGREPTWADFRNGKLVASQPTYAKHFGGIVEARRLATQRSLGRVTSGS